MNSLKSSARLRWTLAAMIAGAISACSDTAGPSATLQACSDFPGGAGSSMTVLGVGLDTVRYTSEVAARGTTAYTSSWGVRRAPGNKVNVWDISGACPALVDSLIVNGATTTGDVAISDDGALLVVASEYSPGTIAIYDLADPRHPKFITQYTNDQMFAGVHTAKLSRVNGKLYGFLGIDPSNGQSFPARLVILDLSTPSAPKQAYVKIAGTPYVHDTYQRDGYLFVALWNDGLDIWDIGGGGSGATPAAPKVLGNVRTLNGEVHNVFWYHDASGGKKFAFVGEEGSGSIGATSRGDIHVVDVSDFTHPREVAFYHVDGAGTHNFSVDEAHGVLYAAYYNGGVRAIDIHGDLGTCPTNQQSFDATANLFRCDLRLMGREIGIGLGGIGRPVYVWGVTYLGGSVYASDMLNGIWKLQAVK